MDLNSLDTGRASNEGATLHLKHPIDSTPLLHEGVPQTITLAGTDSDRWRKNQFEAYRRRVKEARRSNGTLPPETIEAEAVEALAVVTMSWQKIIIDGEELECNKQNATMVYKRFRWIREQVDDFLGDLGNFMKSSQTNSESGPK